MEILFRGKRRNEEWIYGWYSELKCFNGCTLYLISEKGLNGKSHEVIPETVGQYTGLKDKNNVRIFKGDIADIPGWGIGVIKFDRGRFIAYKEGDPFYWLGFCKVDHSKYECEIIGNVTDNPELIN